MSTTEKEISTTAPSPWHQLRASSPPAGSRGPDFFCVGVSGAVRAGDGLLLAGQFQLALAAVVVAISSTKIGLLAGEHGRQWGWCPAAVPTRHVGATRVPGVGHGNAIMSWARDLHGVVAGNAEIDLSSSPTQLFAHLRALSGSHLHDPPFHHQPQFASPSTTACCRVFRSRHPGRGVVQPAPGG
jgi:hypothetical protein